VGNPNVGKSALFSSLCGVYAEVSNYPGTTVDVTWGRMGPDQVVDTPGVYGLSDLSPEETITRRLLLEADVVVNVVSATRLDTDLFLTQQLADAGFRLVVAVNMMDEARTLGLAVDLKLLEALLGVPVVPVVAVRGEGIEELKGALDRARPGKTTPALEEWLAAAPPGEAGGRSGARERARLLLALEEAGGDGKPGRQTVYRWRRQHVDAVVARVVGDARRGASFGVRLGRWMVQPWTGLPLLGAALWLMYQMIGVFVAGTVVDFTEGTLMREGYEPLVRQLAGRLVAADSAAGRLLVGEFGLLTMTVTYLLGILLPLVVGFYLSLLEDSGYLPRIAALADRVLVSLGLNGRAIIPMILGFGCVTMATITTRLLPTDRERRIAVFLLGLAIPCSAQLGVIVAILAGLGPQYAALYALVVVGVLAAVGMALDGILPGRASDLILELPPLRWPRPGNVLRKTVFRATAFLREAAGFFAAGALLLGALEVTGALARIQQALAPLVSGWLGLPAEASTAFVMGLVRRDFGAAGLYDLPLAPFQAVVALVTITLFVPCIASVMIIAKERGRLEGMVMWLATLVSAFTVGGMIRWLGAALGGRVPAVMVAFAGLVLVVAWGARAVGRQLKLQHAVEGKVPR